MVQTVKYVNLSVNPVILYAYPTGPKVKYLIHLVGLHPVPNYSEILGDNIVLLIAQKRVTDTQAAKEIGITRQTLYRLISGKEDVKLSTLVKIAEYLGKSVPALLTPIKI